MKSLLHSRKFWLAVFGVVQAIASHYLDIPADVWQSVAGLIAILILGIAAEDSAQKFNQQP